MTASPCLFPLFARLDNKPVRVVGGGMVAERKVELLLKAGACVSVNAPELTPALARLAQQGDIGWQQTDFEARWLENVWLVIAATSDTALNARTAALCEARRIWVNVVDDPERSSFHVPAIVDRSPVTIAISSGGQAPMLARRIREKLETLIDHSTGRLVALFARWRPAIKRRWPQPGQRRAFYDRAIDGDIGLAVQQHRTQQAEALMAQALQESGESQPGQPKTGKVILVGAGPGEPGLLTLKALRALNQADVILHDRLVSPAVLELARRDATRIFVGKTPGENHHQTQTRIHELMLEHARAGQVVVRLKGGDAFIFGRGGEELAVLAEHGIPFEVVPGITAAIACAAHAGIPLTHRHLSQSLHLFTAHSAQGENQPDWRLLARSNQTLAFYMGVAQLADVARQLITHGLPPDTPFALIENGSLPTQRTLTGTLQNLPELARLHAIHAPALLLIGDVTRLARPLHWFGELIVGTDTPAHATTRHPDDNAEHMPKHCCPVF